MCGEGKTLLQTLLTDKAKASSQSVLQKEITLSVLPVYVSLMYA